MKIALVGYGRMGRQVEAVAVEQGHEVVARLDRGDSLTREALQSADAVVEFTLPESAPDTLMALAGTGVPVVTGTTGWYERLPQVAQAVESAGSALLYAPNFSLGVAVFRRWLAAAARDMDALADYDVSLHETHHTGKVDHPSGTARLLGDTVVQEMARIREWVTWPGSESVGGNELSGDQLSGGPSFDDALSRDQLRVTSARVGHVPGTHEVTFDGPDDQITLTHTARNRRGFASGAVKAAQWIQGRTGVFSLDDMLDDLMGRGNTG